MFGYYSCLLCSKPLKITRWERILLFWRTRGKTIFYGQRASPTQGAQRLVFLVMCDQDVEYSIRNPDVADAIIESRITKYESEGH